MKNVCSLFLSRLRLGLATEGYFLKQINISCIFTFLYIHYIYTYDDMSLFLSMYIILYSHCIGRIALFSV